MTQENAPATGPGRTRLHNDREGVYFLAPDVLIAEEEVVVAGLVADPD